MEDLEQPALPESVEPATSPDLAIDLDDDNTDEPVTAESDDEEFDADGEKYRVPKALKAKLDAGFQRHADYTQKTQAIAEDRRNFEVAQQEFVIRQQFQQQHIEKIADVRAIDRQLEQYQKLDWNSITDADPVQALKLDRQMRELQQQRASTVQSIDNAQRHAQSESSQATARRLNDARESLTRDIPGYGTPALTKALVETAKALGYRPEELENINDPRPIKLLHEAHLYRTLLAKSKAAAKAESTTPVNPITRITGAKAAVSKSPSDMSDKEFATWRHRQIAQRS